MTAMRLAKVREFFILVLFVSLFCSTSLLGLASAIVLLTSLFLLPKEKSFYSSMPLFLPLVAVIAAILLSILFSDPYDRFKAIGKIRYMALYPCLYLAFAQNAALRGKIERCLLPIALILGLLAILEFFGLFSGHWIGLAAPHPIGNVGGFFYHANGLVFHHVPFAFNCGLLFYLLLGSGKNRNWKVQMSATSLVAVSVFLSFSRGGWLALFVSFFVVLTLLFGRKVWLSFAASLIAISLLFWASPVFQKRLLQFDPAQNSDRLILWRISVEMFNESPIVGKGFHSFAAHQKRFMSDFEKTIPNFAVDPHSMYFDFLGGTGILGICAFLLFLFLNLQRGLAAFARAGTGTPAHHRWEIVAGVGFSVFFMVAGLTDSHFFSTYSLNGIIFGLAYWNSAISDENTVI